MFKSSNENPVENASENSAVIPDSQDNIENNSSEELPLLEQWIQRNPSFRHDEMDYIKRAKLGYPCTITGNGDLQQPFNVSGWTFLLVIDKSFPKETEQRELPIRVYLVNPGLVEFKKLYKMDVGNIPCVKKDVSGAAYLHFEEVNDDLDRYVNNRHTRCMSETMILCTKKWVNELQRAIEQEKRQRSRTKWQFGNSLWPSRSGSRYEDYYSGQLGRPKYVDGRASRTDNVNPRCQKVVLSNRALIQIFNESQSKIETETGGLLLGHFEHGIWYVVEASDPGINAVFRVAYHEGDDVYQNHVCDVISRTYKHPLVFLGMWHRHPGSLDSFSGTDDRTNYKYAASAGNGCISAIINYDPDFRITFYYAEQDDNRGVRYTKVDVEVGDERIPNKEIMMLADMNDVISRMS